MYIVESIKNVDEFYGNVGITIGNFEGFHRGHQKIITALKEGCKKRRLKPAVLTFKTHPLRIIKGFEPEKLWSQNDKIKAFSEEGIKFLISINFTRSFADISAENFIKMLVSSVNPALICLGEEFRFGRGNSGSVDMVEEYSEVFNYEFIRVQDALFDGEPISSTRIREAVKSGNIRWASIMLGRNYSFYFKISDSRFFEPFIENQALPYRGRFEGMLIHSGGSMRFRARVFFPERRIKILSNIGLISQIGNIEKELFKFEFYY